MKRKLLIKPGFVIHITLTLALVLIAVTVSDIYLSRRDIYHSKSEEALSLLRAVQKSGENAYFSGTEVENLIADKLVNSAYLISDLEKEKTLDTEELNKISEANNIDHIYLFTNNEKPDLINLNNKYSELNIYNEFSDEVDSVISGKYDYYVAGIVNDNNGISHHLVLHKRNRGKKGFIALSVESDYLLDFRRKIGVGSLFQKIAEGENIEYIVIQDSTGIITASKGVENLSSVESDRFLSASINERKILTREIIFNNKNIFEAVKPFRTGDEIAGIIRIGMSLEPVRSLVNRSIVRSTIISFLLLLTGTIVILFITSSQSYYEEARKRQEKLSAMGELAGGVAHEIRNPLNMISITSQRLQMEFTPVQDREEYKGLLKNMMHEVIRVKNIIDQFLKFSRPQKISKEKVNVKELMENISESFKSKAAGEGIRFSCICDAAEASIDPAQIRQAVNNLLENAFDAVNGEGSVSLEIFENKKNLVIKVTDDGCGIKEEEINRIFNIYYTTKPDGTGLGLSIVNQVVTEHGGVIKVESSPGQGTTFLIEVPLV